MVYSCCAFKCTNTYVKGASITFHSFPKNEERRKLWAAALRRDNFSPSNHSKLCSSHFAKDCFDTAKFGGHWLKNDATPTIFDFTPHSPKVCNPWNSRRKRTMPIPDSESCNSNVASTSRPLPNQDLLNTPPAKKTQQLCRYFGDFKELDKTAARRSRACWMLARNKFKMQQKLIRAMSQKKRRLEKKVASLLNVLVEFKKKSLISDSVLADLQLQTDTDSSVAIKEKIERLFPVMGHDSLDTSVDSPGQIGHTQIIVDVDPFVEIKLEPLNVDLEEEPTDADVAGARH